MIVKNEAHILPRTLPMLCKYFNISYWVISDTGSTDGTQDLIRAFFKERGIPGELVETPWKNFGYNRSIAFEAAYNKSDYVLVWDADDSVIGKFQLPEKLQGDAYEFEFGDATGFRYSRLQLFNNRKRWRYVGVLHEYPAPLDTLGTITHVSGDYYFVSGREGARNKDPDKYKKDAAVLEEGLLEEPDNTRHMFYCANSYMNANDHDNAIRMYKKTIDSTGWTEEKYIACLHLFECGRQTGCPEQYLHYLVESIRYSSARVESIAQLVRYYCVKDMHAVACAYYSLIKDVYEKGYTSAQISKFLFAKKQEFDFFLPYFMIIAGTKAGQHAIAAAMFTHICKQQYVADAWHTRNVFHNMRFIEGLQPTLDLLFSMLEYRDKLPADGFELIQNANISEYIEKCIPLLTADMKSSLKASAKKPRVLLTMPCSSVERFTQAMNAVQRTWTDIGTVDAFYCQRDKVTVQQAKRMREQYPFMEFGPEDVEVYAKKSGATFWIHLDDTAIFVRRDAYVTRSIEALEKHGVQQILYNRNYALTYNDWNINGAGKEIEPGLLLHEIKKDLPAPSCGSWPHFAMRPGCTRIDALKIEHASQSRFVDDGWKTCYFNRISHVFAGKDVPVNACTLGPDQIQFYKRSVDTNMFVVNLERRPDRRAEVEQKFAAAGVKNYAFVRAVDGKELVATPELATMFKHNNFGTKRGAVGCALSHYRLWQRLIVDKKYNHYVIFEDDIDLCERFTEKLAAIPLPDTMELLMLGYHTWNNESRFSGDGSVTTLDARDYAGGTFGYIITKKGAEKLCGAIKSDGCTKAIDWFMVHRDNNTTPCHKILPQLVLSEWVQTNSSPVDSDIQRDHDALDLSTVKEDVQKAGNIRWRFIPGIDSFGNDITCVGRKSIQELLSVASTTDKCVAVNTLGYLKHKVEQNLIKPGCFGPEDGLFIREQ